jgi:hypothetical protein
MAKKLGEEAVEAVIEVLSATKGATRSPRQVPSVTSRSWKPRNWQTAPPISAPICSARCGYDGAHA